MFQDAASRRISQGSSPCVVLPLVSIGLAMALPTHVAHACLATMDRPDAPTRVL